MNATAPFNGINQIKLTQTRYAGLMYGNSNPVGKPCWRIYDCHDTDRAAAVGPLYPTKAELLADLEAYAASWGY